MREVSLRSKIAIFSVGLLTFLGILTETSLTVAFPILMKQFNASLDSVQWLTSGYLLMVTVVMCSTAYLNERFPAQAMFRFAVVTCFCGSLLCALAPNLALLMAGRLLQAMATGVATPLMYHLIFELVPLHRLGFYVGLAAMVVSLAPALGPVYGGILTNFISWRMIFWILVPLIAVLALVGFRYVILPASKNPRRFDAIGLALLAVSMLGLIEVVNQWGRMGIANWGFAIRLVITFTALALLVVHAIKGKRQIINFHLLARSIVRLRAANYFIFQFANIGISVILPLFSQKYLGTSALVAGLIMLPGSIAGAFISPFAGKTYDKHGPRITITLGNVSMMVGCALLCWFTKSSTVLTLTLLYMFIRIGFNTGFGSTMSDATKRVAPAEKGDVNTMFNTFQQYAGSLGTSVLAAAITAFEGRTSSVNANAAVASGTQLDFLMLTVLAFFGLIFTLMTYRLDSPKAKPVIKKVQG
ncbi:MAG: MFS transporter [Bifidobacterium aquikefiri]|uniref:Permease of the major facilitator superfamily protein n=2 Tax=Bifidobacterium aquikefiri TaxID=1653207 RepID=A0A261G839_9BIFI|nr:permease of the major facilitator superfamily protein [Bifidobacterium aquikefiri]